MEDKLKKLKGLIEESNYLVFFGGAGVSTASNIPDFRSASGLYNEKQKYDPEEILSRHFFNHKTKEFYEYYFNKMIYKNAIPNDCHKYLKKLEDQGKLKVIITQNIDGLHSLAGSKNVLELHGSVKRNYCMNCHKFYSLDDILNNKDNVPKCSCGGIIKPDVVLYEESLNCDTFDESIKHLKKADTLIIGGTSLKVYPAALLIDYFHGKNLVVINKELMMIPGDVTLYINDDINKVFKLLGEAE